MSLFISLTLIASQALAADPSPDVRVVKDSDRKEFNAKMLPGLTQYLAFWESKGISLRDRHVRYFVGAPKGVTADSLLRAYFGPNWKADMKSARDKIQAAKSASELKQALDQGTCQFPLLLNHWRLRINEDIAAGLVEPDEVERVQAPSTGILDDAIAGDAASVIDAMKFPEASNADYTYTGELVCDFVRMSREVGSFTENGKPEKAKLPAYLDSNTVWHETGHGLHFALWSVDGPIAEAEQAPFVHEALADIFTTSVVGNACYGPLANGGCLRRMDRFDRAVWDAATDSTGDPHKDNEAIRNFLWLARQVDPKAFPQVLSDAVRALGPVLRANPASMAIPGGADSFLELKREIERVGLLASSLFAQVCAGIRQAGPCAETARFLGQPDSAFLAQLAANAPTAIGVAGRDVMLKGQPARIRFEFAEEYGENRLHAFVDQGANHFEYSSTGLRGVEKVAGGGHRASMGFSPTGVSRGAKFLTWWSDGRVE